MREVKARWMMVLGSVLILSGAIWLLTNWTKAELNNESSARNISDANLALRVSVVEKRGKRNTALATANAEALKQKASKADLNKVVKRVSILEHELKSLTEDVRSIFTTLKTNTDTIAENAKSIGLVITEVAAHALRLDKLEVDVAAMKDCLGACCGKTTSCSKYKPKRKPHRTSKHRKPKAGNGVATGGTPSVCRCTGQPNCKCNSKSLARGGNKKKLKRKPPVHVVLMEEVVEETTGDGTTL